MPQLIPLRKIIASIKMVQINKIQILILTTFAFNVAFSQIDQNKHHLDDVYKECYNKQKGDYGALYCAIDVGKEWNKEMNRYYGFLMNVLDTNAQNELKLAQEQWIKYRDLEYRFSGSLHDLQGTMYLRMRAYRNMRIVRTRALELKYYYWVRTEDEEPKSYKSNKVQVVSLENEMDSILPTPDVKFINSLDKSRITNAEYVIEKYIDTFFHITKQEEVIEKASISHTEIPGEDCRYRTEYNRSIAVEKDYGCDSYDQTTTIEFTNYSLREVKRVLKCMLPTKYNRENDYGNPVDSEGWDESDGDYNYNGNCSLHIHKEENKILVQFGCGC